MAKKATVKPRKQLSAKSTAREYDGLTAKSFGEQPVLGANLVSLSQQMDSAEQSREVDSLRKQAKEKLKKKKVASRPVANSAAPTSAKADTIPPGTFKNVDGELVVGDMKKYQAWQLKTKKKATVKKK